MFGRGYRFPSRDFDWQRFRRLSVVLSVALAAIAVQVNPSRACASEIVYEDREVYDLFTVDPETKELTRLTSTERILEATPKWSPDRTRIAFWNRSGGDALFVMNADGSGRARLTNSMKADGGVDVPASGAEIISDFDWSPDGSRLVYAHNAYSAGCYYIRERGFVATVAPDGSDRQVLTGNQATFEAPKWSPDGTKVAVVRKKNRRPMLPALITMNPDGTDKRVIFKARDQYDWIDFEWSADGQELVFSLEGFRYGDSDIFRVDADGGTPQRLTDFAGEDIEPQWSPDGRFISYLSSRGRSEENEYSFDLMLIAADGSGKQRLLDNLVAVTDHGQGSYDWSPDSQSIVYERFTPVDRGYQYEWLDLFVVDVTTGETSPLVQEPGEQILPDW